MTPTESLSDILEAVRDVPGWMTDEQARRLWAAAAQVPEGGRIVEIGSFRGRSLIVLAKSAGPLAELVSIDPHAGTDRGPLGAAGQEATAMADHAAYRENLERAQVLDQVRHVRAFSSDALDEVTEPIDLLYIDGAHQRRAALADIEAWGAKVREGGTMLIHDSFSSVGVTTAIATSLLYSRRWRYQGRSGSLAEYRRVRTSAREARRSTAEQLAALPWFLRNVGVKVLQGLRLGRWTKVLGHEGSHPPF